MIPTEVVSSRPGAARAFVRSRGAPLRALIVRSSALVRAWREATHRRSSPARGRRLDIQGLRAVCMIQVLGFHAWGIGSPIGVDAFIMISAYLLTGSFVRRCEEGRTPWFVERWLHTFKRLMPPLVATVLPTVAASLLILPRSRWIETLIQGAASVTYWQNWRLAAVSADYFADDHAASSPLQHLWSMSMQGQVFLLWPLLMAGCAVLAARRGLAVRRVVVAVFALLAAASLAWLLLAAPADGSVYFDTRARIWEFALGSAIAAAAPWLRPRAERACRLLSWGGLAILLLFCTVSIGSYPGPMAAVPMLAVAVILLCGTAPAPGTVSRLLSRRPLVELGDRSYAVYLLHWPLFVLYLAVVGREALSMREGVMLVVVVLAAAVALTRYVDRPAQALPRSGRRLRLQAAMVSASLVLGLAPLGLAGAAVARERAGQLAALDAAGTDADHPGAFVLTDGRAEPWRTEPVPGPLLLSRDWLNLSNDGCSPKDKTRFDTLDSSSCRYLGGSDDAAQEGADGRGALRVVIAGDSHLEQNILPAMQELHRDDGWDLTAVLKGGCSFTVPGYGTGECSERNTRLLESIEQSPPDVVVLQTTRTTPDSSDETLYPGVTELIENLTGRGITVIGVRDNPRSRKNLYECSDAVDPTKTMGGCLLPRSDYLAPADPAIALTGIAGFHEVDFTDLICRDGVCPTIIGNVFVYRDEHHISGAYAKTMGPTLAARVEQAVASER